MQIFSGDYDASYSNVSAFGMSKKAWAQTYGLKSAAQLVMVEKHKEILRIGESFGAYYYTVLNIESHGLGHVLRPAYASEM